MNTVFYKACNHRKNEKKEFDGSFLDLVQVSQCELISVDTCTHILLLRRAQTRLFPTMPWKKG